MTEAPPVWRDLDDPPEFPENDGKHRDTEAEPIEALSQAPDDAIPAEALTPPYFLRRPTTLHNYFARTFAPKVLHVIHMTGNSSTSAMLPGLGIGSGALAEWRYAATNPAAADGPSAHDYIARDGVYLEMLDPASQVAWSNGDLTNPQLQYPGVAYLADLKARGINANRGVYRETESVAYPGTYPVTAAQRETIAWLIALDSIETGLNIVPGATVLVHSWINWTNRQNCPFPPTQRTALLAAVCQRATAIKAALLTPVEEPVKAFPVPEIETKAILRAGAWLYDNSQLQPSPGNIELSTQRELPYVGIPSGQRAVAYDPPAGDPDGSAIAMWVKDEDVIGYITYPPVDCKVEVDKAVDDAVLFLKATAKAEIVWGEV